MFKKILVNSLIIFAFCMIYTILAEEFTLKTLLIGFFVAVLSIGLTNLFICDINYHNFIEGNIFKLIAYIFYLLIKIVISGVKTISFIASGEAEANFFEYRSELRSDFKLNLLSNSITLTPGTVTVDRKDNIIFIMQMCKINDGYRDTDIKRFEDRINKI